MKFFFTLIAIILISNPVGAQFQFVSPMPGSINLPIEHNVILRPGSLLDTSSVQSSLFIIQGTKSGLHNFKLILCDDGKTINLNPEVEFAFDDTVTVSVANGLAAIDGSMIGACSFYFITHPAWNAIPSGLTVMDSAKDDHGIHGLQPEDNGDVLSNPRSMTGLFTINTNVNPAPGTIFFDSRSELFQQSSYTSICAIGNDGDSVYQKAFSTTPYDFQLGKNGYFDTYQGSRELFDVLDSNFCVIDSYKVTNGFAGDPHELTMLANGYAFMTGTESQQADSMHANDSSGITLIGTVIQEFDPHHNIIFEWRSFDHIDGNESEHVNLGADIVDLVHTNSIDVDNDGNILASHRHLNQITKIDVNTGAFIWRLGGVKNEFTFTNDTARFTYQHDCRRIANGNITLYDDGNYHVPHKSYAKEYHLDEVNKTATLVWSYSHPDVNGHVAYYPAMGSVQRLPNGNTFIGWGWRSSTWLPDITEVDSNGNIVWELTLTSNKFFIDYRAHKYLWDPCARPTFDSINATFITDHSAKLTWMRVANPSQQYEVQYKKHNDSTWMDSKISSANSFLVIMGLQPATDYDWRIQSWCDTVAGTASHFTAVKTFTTLGYSVSDYFMLLYPNPVSDAVKVECSSRISGIRVFNILGQEVKNISVSKNSSVRFIELSVASLAPGNYLVEVMNDVKKDVRMIVVE